MVVKVCELAADQSPRPCLRLDIAAGLMHLRGNRSIPLGDKVRLRSMRFALIISATKTTKAKRAVTTTAA